MGKTKGHTTQPLGMITTYIRTKMANPRSFTMFKTNCEKKIVKVDRQQNKTKKLGEKDSCLAKLREYFLANNQVSLCQHNFQNCIQAEGEALVVWWSRKKVKAEQCPLKMMRNSNVMVLELICRVHDPLLW